MAAMMTFTNRVDITIGTANTFEQKILSVLPDAVTMIVENLVNLAGVIT